MINGAHIVLFSDNAEADRDFFRNIVGFPFVDAGHGWLIFRLPAAEAAFHPSDSPSESARHELYLICDNLKSEMAALRATGVECSEVVEEPWGSLTHIRLPGGSKLGLYQAKHARP